MKEKRLFVKPSSPDLVVMDANNIRIPADGRSVPNSVFIRRRIKDGALIVTAPPITSEGGAE